MDQKTESISISTKENILRQKCPVHQNMNCDLLNLSSSAERHRICFSCLQQNTIPAADIIPIGELLNANSSTFFSTYPKLTSTNILSQIQGSIGSVEHIINLIDEGINYLQQQLNIEVENLRTRSKIQVSKLSEAYQSMMESYETITNIQEFQKIILTTNNEEVLHQFIIKHLHMSASNTDNLSSKLKTFSDQQKAFKPTELQIDFQKLLDTINNLEFFQKEAPRNSSRIFEENLKQILKDNPLDNTPKQQSKNITFLGSNKLNKTCNKCINRNIPIQQMFVPDKCGHCICIPCVQSEKTFLEKSKNSQKVCFLQPSCQGVLKLKKIKEFLEKQQQQ